MASPIFDLEAARTDQQELFYDLEDTTAIIGWSAAELKSIAGHAKTPDEAVALLKICALLLVQQGKLKVYAEEVKTGRIKRAAE